MSAFISETYQTFLLIEKSNLSHMVPDRMPVLSNRGLPVKTSNKAHQLSVKKKVMKIK